MRRDDYDFLNSLLADWHRWARGWKAVAQHGASAMFAGVKSSRQWDSENEVIDASLHNAQMQAFDFQVGELEPMYRTALQIHARNLVTGRSVWISARLPADIEERAIILQKARNSLLKRLTSAGIV